MNDPTLLSVPAEVLLPGDNVTEPEYLTVSEVLKAHAEVGRLDWHMVKKAMGPNWPEAWEQLGPGEAIFAPEEDRA